MKKIIATTLLTITFAATAEASCFGTKAFMTCSDGNSYSTYRQHQHSVPTRILDQAGAKLLLAITLLALLVLGQVGTAITTARAAGVPTAEVILGAASETSAINSNYKLG